MARVVLFSGHYGSGKTNLAAEYALHLAKQGIATSIADLDIVNPYFRAKDARDALERAGVRFISSPYANSNVDTPALPAESYSIIHDRSRHAVVDVGGDDRGALALGRYARSIREEGDYAMYLVANFYRPLTRSAAALDEVRREIETACALRFTAIVNNSNLGKSTTPQSVAATDRIAKEAAELMGIPLAATTVRADLRDGVSELIDGRIIPITLHFKEEWAI